MSSPVRHRVAPSADLLVPAGGTPEAVYGGVKVLIQNTADWKYLAGRDWANRGDEAEDFLTISHAQEAAEANGIEDFRIVGFFADDHHAMEIPITG